jgi:hypothetical protein
MEQKVNMITLGVSDLAASTAFYRCLGWQPAAASQDTVTFFQAGGVVLGLFPRDALAEDAKLPALPGPGSGAFTIAQNLASRDLVDRAIEEAVAAGATLIKAAEDVFWGGYSGYFADLDGHLWEVAWNPFFPLDDNGLIRLPA